MKKILIIGPAWVGDMVMSQSLYIVLKQRHPDSQIYVIAPGWCKPILERMPEIHQAIEMPIGHGEFNLLGRREIGKSLREKQYDHAYILPKSAKSALIPWFANIPLRTGWKGEMRYGLLNDLRPNMKSFQYMVERYVALAYPKAEMVDSNSLGGLETLPRPRLAINAAEQQATLKKFNLTQDQPIIGLCPGAEFGPAKKWPETHYAEVATQMARSGHQIWLFGSQKDLETCNNIRALVPTQFHENIHVLAGQTSLIEAVDLLAACKAVRLVPSPTGTLTSASLRKRYLQMSKCPAFAAPTRGVTPMSGSARLTSALACRSSAFSGHVSQVLCRRLI